MNKARAMAEVRIGAVVVFGEGVDRQMAEAFLRNMEKRLVLDGSQWVDGVTPVHEFDPRSGGPVWYIP